MTQATFRRLFLTASLTALLSANALADSRVFLLQLGSFESEAEAQTRWLQLRDKYPQLMEGLSARTLDVTLPPDNFTVYRTQAGALESRSDAQVICDRLTAAGDECYVVETAMFTPDMLQQNAARSTQSAPAPQLAAPQLAASVPATAELATDNAPELAVESDISAATTAANAALTAPLPEPDMDIGAPAEVTLARTPVIEREESSFWDWLNPFSDSEQAQEVEAAQTPESLLASGKDSIEIEPAEVASELVPAVPEAPTDTPAPVLPETELRAELPSFAQAQPVDAVQAEPVTDLSFRLPPPPAPPAQPVPQPAPKPTQLAGRPQAGIAPEVLPVGVGLRHEGSTASAPASQSASAAPTLPAVIPFQVKRDGQVVTAPQNLIEGSGDVKVAEAIRVPVSEINRVSPAPFEASKLRALGMPSAPMGVKNLWAEITAFKTQQEALAFWDAFRAANPTFPPVRVRITSPYIQTRTSSIALRVGPFDAPALIDDICAEVSSETIRCALLREVSQSSSARMGERSVATPESRRERQQQRAAAEREPMYWVQLGTYSSQAAANQAWGALQQRHEPLLNEMRPDLAFPDRSSSNDAVYRLRTGPFLMRAGASSLCSSLQMRGTKCMTVFSR